MFLRVISDLKRWNTEVCGNSQLIPADCFSDIKTTHNTLSLWQIDENDITEIENFAVLSTLNRNELKKISYILISTEELSRIGLKFSQTNNVPDYLISSQNDVIKHHYDITDIDHQNYGKIATLFRDKIRGDKLEIISEIPAIDAAKRLYHNGIINIKPLKEKIKQTIQASI